jgi:hypothetical protein
MWERLARTVDSSVDFLDKSGQIDTMKHNDQAAFASAVEMTGFNPFVLPLNWNFRPKWHRSFFGPLRVWHDPAEPPQDLLKFNEYHEDYNAVVVEIRMD